MQINDIRKILRVKYQRILCLVNHTSVIFSHVYSKRQIQLQILNRTRRHLSFFHMSEMITVYYMKEKKHENTVKCSFW